MKPHVMSENLHRDSVGRDAQVFLWTKKMTPVSYFCQSLSKISPGEVALTLMVIVSRVYYFLLFQTDKECSHIVLCRAHQNP